MIEPNFEVLVLTQALLSIAVALNYLTAAVTALSVAWLAQVFVKYLAARNKRK